MIFLYGSIWFWLLVSVELLFLLSLTKEEEHGFWELTSLLTFLGVLSMWGDINLFKWAFQNIGTFLVGFLAYFGIGLAWSVGKWVIFLKGIKWKYEEIKEKFIVDYEIEKGSPIPEKYMRDFLIRITENVNEIHIYKDKAKMPSLTNSKYRDKITYWITYWPFSMFWTFCYDLIETITKAIVNRFKNLYSKIIETILGDVSKEMDDCIKKKQ